MSYPTGKQILDSAIKFALSTIPEDELQKLFASLGYDTDDVTLELCIEAWDKFGEEFTKPFFSLAQDQLDDADKMKAVRKSLQNSNLFLSRADGKSEENNTSGKFDQQKWENAQSVLGYLFGMCESGYKTYSQAQNDANAAAIKAESEAKAAALEAQAQQNMTKWIIIGGGVILVVIVVLAIIISMRK